MKRLGKPVAASVLAGGLLLGGPVVPGLADQIAGTAVAASAKAASTTSATTNAAALTMVREAIVTAGVRQRSYVWTRPSRANGQIISTNLNVIIADLHNPNVKLDVMTGVDGQLAEKANVLNMAKTTGAVAGVNADYFDMSIAEAATLGPQVGGGALMATPTQGLQGMYAFGITKQNKPIIETFASQGAVTAANGQTYALSGLNRVVSTIGNAIYMYDASWGSATRARDAATHTEVLVTGGVVQAIYAGSRYPEQIPAGSYILSAGGTGAEFVSKNVNVGDKLSAKSSLTPVNPNLTYTENDFKMLVGGHTMLVIDGVPAAYTRDVSSIQPNGNTSRTAVGFSKEQRYVYMVTADHAAGSVGPALPDFQKLLIELGVWRAVNLDGGGSTTAVARPLGDFEAQLVNVPKDGAMRRVVNGIGVFTTSAPAALKDFILNGPKLLWKGQSASYSVKAYDVNYNPLDPAKLAVPVQFKAREGNMKLDPATNVFQAVAGGADTVVAYSGNVNEEVTVEIIDRRLIQKLDVVPSKSPSAWTPGDNVKLTLKATLTDGRLGTIPAELVRWEHYGASGSIAGDLLTFGGFAEGTDTAMLVARFDGFSTPLAVPVPRVREAMLADFDAVKAEAAAESYPENVAVANVKLLGRDVDKQLHLAYDFKAGDGETDLAAYATFGGAAGLPLAEGAVGFRLELFGDGQGGRLRAEFIDAAGTVRRVTLADKVDWVGWRAVSVDLQDFEARALKRLYMISKSPLAGEVVFDDLKAVYADAKPAEETPLKVDLTVGKREVLVGGQPQKLDVAPLIEKDRTFVPVRFVVDALGGYVDWNAEEKKVTIRKGVHFIELWVGEPEMIADGERIASDAAPILRSSRTLLPLRFVTEQLGMTVDYDPATRDISIR